MNEQQPNDHSWPSLYLTLTGVQPNSHLPFPQSPLLPAHQISSTCNWVQQEDTLVLEASRLDWSFGQILSIVYMSCCCFSNPVQQQSHGAVTVQCHAAASQPHPAWMHSSRLYICIALSIYAKPPAVAQKHIFSWPVDQHCNTVGFLTESLSQTTRKGPLWFVTRAKSLSL